MIVLVGASASGKTELAKALCKTKGYKKCVTTTTRPMRKGEKDGLDYRFVDLETFEKLEHDDALVESTTYDGNRYGIQKSDVRTNGVVIVDPSGANALLDTFGESVFIVHVATSEPVRKERMATRGDAPEDILARLANDRLVFNEGSLRRIDLVVNNETDPIDVLAESIHTSHFTHILNRGKNNSDAVR